MNKRPFSTVQLSTHLIATGNRGGFPSLRNRVQERSQFGEMTMAQRVAFVVLCE